MRTQSLAACRRSSRNAGGFTLIELIITIVLLGILAAAGITMLVDNFSTSRMVDADNTSTAQARYALERLAREIREIKRASSDSPCGTNTQDYCISTPATLPTTLTIVPGNSTLSFTNGNNETVTLAGSGTTLNLDGKPLCSNVTSLVLTFAVAVDSTTAISKNTVRFVTIDLSVADPESGQAIVQRTRVALRN